MHKSYGGHAQVMWRSHGDMSRKEYSGVPRISHTVKNFKKIVEQKIKNTNLSFMINRQNLNF